MPIDDSWIGIAVSILNDLRQILPSHRLPSSPSLTLITTQFLVHLFCILTTTLTLLFDHSPWIWNWPERWDASSLEAVTLTESLKAHPPHLHMSQKLHTMSRYLQRLRFRSLTTTKKLKSINTSETSLVLHHQSIWELENKAPSHST